MAIASRPRAGRLVPISTQISQMLSWPSLLKNRPRAGLTGEPGEQSRGWVAPSKRAHLSDFTGPRLAGAAFCGGAAVVRLSLGFSPRQAGSALKAHREDRGILNLELVQKSALDRNIR